jgi:hypothetical protein
MAAHTRTQTLDLDLDLKGLPLLDSPWSVRFARGTRGRVALEVYNNGLLLDVLVARPLAADALRGARRGERDGRPSVLAWGHLPPDGAPPDVAFSRRHGATEAAEAVTAAGAFWLALSHDCFDRVAVTRADGGVEQLRVRAGWSR